MTAVLFVRLSAMGDVVHGLGAMEALHRVRPDWSLTLVTQPESLPLLEALPWPLQTVAFARRAGLAGLWALRRELQSRSFDVALDLQGNWKSAFVARLSGARQRIGMADRWRQEPASRRLLHRVIDAPGTPHPARAAWQLVCSLAADAPFVLPRLWARDEEIARERRALIELGIDCAQPLTVLVLSDPADPRALRPDRLAGIAAKEAGRVLVVAGPAETAIAGPSGVPVLRHRAGELRRLVALGAVVAEIGGVVIGPDQGATHVLSAAGADTRVLFGAQDPLRTSPPGAKALVHPEPPTCSPCRRRTCDHVQGPVCMQFDPERARIVDCDWPVGG